MTNQDGPKRPSAKKRKANLDRLARRLIARHVRIAVPDSAVRDRLSEQRNCGVYGEGLVERDMHCIAVVGAGASAPLLKRGQELAGELEDEFGRDEVELERLELVNNLDRRDFETRLIALSKSREVERQVRNTMSAKYSVEHPTLLVYELLAHLLKHRFLDAIISFNFDELLDRSLDDELEPSEYKRVLSERDCKKIQGDPSAPDYVPLYVKLHGTASEPDSLRFTSDSYYSIPERVLGVVKELLHTTDCVIVNIGFGFGSFDFQRLMSIPQRLDIYNLSRDRINEKYCETIDYERAHRGRPRSQAKPMANRKKRPADKPGHPYAWLYECALEDGGCDGLMQALTTKIDGLVRVKGKARSDVGDLVQFRSVGRHEAVAKLLGPSTLDREWASTPRWSQQERTDYARRRTILELAFAGAKASGLLSLVPLAGDRPARYFDDYRELIGGRGEDWGAMCAAAGLVESTETPDILLSHVSLRKRSSKPSRSKKEDRKKGGSGKQKKGGMAKERETLLLHKFDPDKLARHVLARVKNPSDRADFVLLARTLRELQRKTDIELHMRDDRVCSKAFKRPATLASATSLEAYTWLILKDIKSMDTVFISSEKGDWLLREPFLSLLMRLKKDKLVVLLAFEDKAGKLDKQFGNRLKSVVVDPWRHSRHMTIVCERDSPKRAVYFARRLRTPMVTAVYLESVRDVQRLTQMFKQRWDEAEEEEKLSRRRV